MISCARWVILYKGGYKFGKQISLLSSSMKLAPGVGELDHCLLTTAFLTSHQPIYNEKPQSQFL